MASFEHAVTRNLQCSICLELMVEPKLLSCSHTFCKTCLTSLLTSTTVSNLLSCPVCRSVTEVKSGQVSNLKTNIPLKSLIADVKDKGQPCEVCENEYRAIFYCCDCEHNMCDKCHDQHNSWKLNRNHRVVSVSELRQGRVILKKKVWCKDHEPDENNVCTDVCMTCKTFICLRCRMLHHEKKGHIVKSSREYIDSSTKEIESVLTKAQPKTRSIRECIANLDNLRQKDLEHLEEVKSDAKRFYDEAIRKLIERKSRIDKKCDAEMVWVRKKYKLMTAECKSQEACVKCACELASKISTTPLEEDTLTIRESLTAELGRILNQDSPNIYKATSISAHVHTFAFEWKELDDLELGCAQYSEWTLKADVALECSMTSMTSLYSGKVAVGSWGGKIKIFLPDGQLETSVLNEELKSYGIGCLSDGRYVVLDKHLSMSIYSSEWDKLDTHIKNPYSHWDGQPGYLAIDDEDNICVSYKNAQSIKVISLQGDGVRDIPCNGYKTTLMYEMKSKGLLLVSDHYSVAVIDSLGEVIYNLEQEGDDRAYPCVLHNGSVFVAWISSTDGQVTIKEYTKQLMFVATLISDFKTNRTARDWYQLQEFVSGEIALCTTDTLYIFH